MTRRRLPRNDAAILDAELLLDGEIAFDTTNKQLRVGDGSTVGGLVVGSDVGGGGDGEFTQVGTGAVTRTVSARLQDSFSVLDFIPVAEHAAIRDGTTTTDVTSYIVAAMTAAQTVSYGEKRLVFPTGKYRVTRLNLRDYNFLTLHAEGTVQIVGIDGTQGYIMGDSRYDDLGHTENFTSNFRMTGGLWLIAPLAGQAYARGLKLQNFVDCVFENVSVSGTYTPAGGTGNRIAVELELSFNNRFDNMTVGYPGAPIGADGSYGLFMGIDNVNANRFFGYRGVGGGGTIAQTYGVRMQGAGNCFFGGDISAVHTCWQDHAARGCHRFGMHHEGVSKVLGVSFASRGCTIEAGWVSILANGTAYDLSGHQTIRYTIRGGNHTFSATGTTGINKGASCYALTYEPCIDYSVGPVTAMTGNDVGSGGTELLKGHELSTSKISFPDYGGDASTNPTTLDCYLENDVPVLGITVGATTQTTGSVLKITKIGRQVFVTGYVQMAAAVSGTGPVVITGLPYESAGRTAGPLSLQNATFTGHVHGVITGTQCAVYLNGAQMTQTTLTSTSLFDVGFSYTALA